VAVSITYSPRTVVVAASYDGPLGIDLEEPHSRAVGPLANRWFTPHEVEWTSRQPEQLTAFLHLWTAKEAVGKALGLGLGQSGLSRAMPLPSEAGTAERRARDDVLYADLVPGEDGLAVMHVGLQHLGGPPGAPEPVGHGGSGGSRGPGVLALAASSDLSELVVHQAGLLNTVSRGTSFPIVVRSN
jgi:hypothetical protein